MGNARKLNVINDFLGSAHIFSSAVRNLMVGQIHRVLGEELTLSQVNLLKMVAMTDGRSLGDVAGFLGVSHAAASKAVDRLVRRGLIERKESSNDRRAVQLSLAAEGHLVLDKYEEAQGATMGRIFRQFNAEELSRTADLLDKISTILVSQGDGSEEICLRCGIYFRDKCLLRQVSKSLCYYHHHKRSKAETGSAAVKPG
jgi:DNA-binding MarR family transcriptional regulator